MMIMHWFKLRRKRRAAAKVLYRAAAARVKEPFFYDIMGVADTFDGRFDLLCLHVCLLVERLNQMGREGQKLGQFVFDEMFRTMDLSLREMGVGDVGIPKRMQKMMKAFNGRAHVYHAAFSARDFNALHLALTRNVYRANGEGIPKGSADLAAYALSVHDALMTLSLDQMMDKDFSFPKGEAQRYGKAI